MSEGAVTSEAVHDARSPIAAERLRFPSGGQECAATLYRPDAAAPGSLACVVMANGFGLTRRDGLPAVAERFARAGMAALTFDFRHLGDSTGEPRQLIDHRRQRRDVTAAVGYARTLDAVDPDKVAVWGFSYGGGMVVYAAAEDRRLRAVVTRFPVLDGIAYTRAGGADLSALLAEACRGLLRRRTMHLPITGPPGSRGVVTQPGARAAVEAVIAEDSRWRNEFRAHPLLPPAAARPVRVAHRIRCPLLTSIGTRDTVAPPRPIGRAAVRAPRGELRRYPVAHFETFDDAIDEITADEIDFLRRHLQVDQAPSRS